MNRLEPYFQRPVVPQLRTREPYMKTMLTDAGENRLRALVDHFNELTTEPVTPQDSAEVRGVVLEILEIVRDHKAVLDMALADKRDLVELLERRLELRN